LRYRGGGPTGRGRVCNAHTVAIDNTQRLQPGLNEFAFVPVDEAGNQAVASVPVFLTERDVNPVKL
jgi:hypothetical protein